MSELRRYVGSQPPMRLAARFLLFLLSFSILLSGRGASAGPRLAVWSGEPEKWVASFPIRPGETFSIRFINSIYLAPVTETFLYEAGQGIVLVKVESPSAGVFEYYGLEPDNSGVTVLKVKVPELRLRSHDYLNHRLAIRDRLFYLKDFVQNGEPVIIRIEE